MKHILYSSLLLCCYVLNAMDFDNPHTVQVISEPSQAENDADVPSSDLEKDDAKTITFHKIISLIEAITLAKGRLTATKGRLYFDDYKNNKRPLFETTFDDAYADITNACRLIVEPEQWKQHLDDVVTYIANLHKTGYEDCCQDLGVKGFISPAEKLLYAVNRNAPWLKHCINAQESELSDGVYEKILKDLATYQTLGFQVQADREFLRTRYAIIQAIARGDKKVIMRDSSQSSGGMKPIDEDFYIAFQERSGKRKREETKEALEDPKKIKIEEEKPNSNQPPSKSRCLIQ